MKPKRVKDDPTTLSTLQAIEKRHGISVNSLRDLVATGDLPHVRFPNNRRIFVKNQDFEKLLEASTEHGRK